MKKVHSKKRINVTPVLRMKDEDGFDSFSIFQSPLIVGCNDKNEFEVPQVGYIRFDDKGFTVHVNIYHHKLDDDGKFLLCYEQEFVLVDETFDVAVERISEIINRYFCIIKEYENGFLRIVSNSDLDKLEFDKNE